MHLPPRISILAALLAAFLSGSSISPIRGEGSTGADEGIEFFEKQVRPLLVAKCYECHAGSERHGGLRLDSPAQWRQGGDSGPAIVPGRPEESRLLEALHYRNRDLQMPPQGALPAAEVAVFEQWIAMGAPDPRQEPGTPAAAGPMGMEIEEGRQHWSMRPLGDYPLPAVRQLDWVCSPIDHFVLAGLEASELQPSPTIDKRTWLRRVSLDLIGLPPTPEEIAQFLADDGVDAYERVVDRLLQSPSYGIRWARHWLDLARFADSNGLDENLAFGNAWRYRDYVIQAFNEDKPFDQFLIEQLAGDLLPQPTRETRIATGFLVLGAKVLAEPDHDKLIMDTIDEQLDTLGKVFWGMSLGCVRCHDHKFDPLKQTDYYGLAAIFKSTQTFGSTRVGAIHHWNEFEFATPEEKKSIAAIDKEIASRNKAVADFRKQAVNQARAAARAKAVEYLLAAATLSSECSLTEAAQAAQRDGLNPHVLHRCCRFLAAHQQEDFFQVWRESVTRQDFTAIESHYRGLFERVEAAWMAAQKATPKGTKLDSPELETARIFLYDGKGFLAIPSKPDFSFDAATLAEYRRMSEEAIAFESQAQDLPAAMGVSEAAVHRQLPIHIRGSHRNLGVEVPRGFPRVMMNTDQPPILPRTESGRLELAKWMAHPEHPLTARVYVNRLWRWHFGRGLVASTDNFGSTGDRPSHPELLDWLARYFVEAKWSTKAMHRLIVLSHTYRMAGSLDEIAIDPENRLLWKFPLQRMEAEQLRDSLLAVTGKLDSTMGGKSIPLRNRQFVFNHTSTDRTQYQSHRRSIYIPVIRNNLYGFFEQFDFPDPTMPTGSRNQTTVPAQALALMNSPLVMHCSRSLAHQLLASLPGDQERVGRVFEMLYSRPPTAEDFAIAARFFEEVAEDPSVAVLPLQERQLQSWTLYCQSLLASNEFVYIR
jgi:hypothetical protein